MFKRFRKATIVRSLTGDSSTLRRLRNRSSSPRKVRRDRSDATASTMDSSSDEAEGPRPIRWERTPSGHMRPCQQQQQNHQQTMQELRKARMKELPSTAAFSSNHILVNRERIHRGKAPLIRCRHLDGIAKKHAEEMARACQLLATPICSVTMAENVQRGPSIRVIHQMIMVGVSDTERDNILSERFSRFGMGTAPGEDGMIYMSQVFQETAARRRPTC